MHRIRLFPFGAVVVWHTVPNRVMLKLDEISESPTSASSKQLLSVPRVVKLGATMKLTRVIAT